MENKTAERSRPKFTAVFMLVLDLFGTFLFGIEGALAAIKGNLDFFGAMVLAFCTALGGGIIRDLLIGDIPPGSIREWQYGATALLGGTTAVFLNHFLQAIPPMLMITLDAGGLSLFAISGAIKATSFRIHPILAILMGTITGVGGGTVRDILLAQIPGVLRADIYATAAMLGAAVFVTGVKLGLSLRWAAILGGVACFALRILAVQHQWNLPSLGAQR